MAYDALAAMQRPPVNPLLQGFLQSQQAIQQQRMAPLKLQAEQQRQQQIQQQMEQQRQAGPLALQQAQQRIEQERAMGPLKQQQMQQQVAGMPAQQELWKAQAERARGLAAHPERAQAMTGAAGEIESIERLKQLHGPDSPQVKAAERKFKAVVGRAEAYEQYYGRPTIEKLDNLKNRQLKEGQYVAAAQTSATISKTISDPKTREQYQGLDTLMHEVNNIDMEKIAPYAGLYGHGKAHWDELMHTMTGKVNPNYEAYRNFTMFQGKAMADRLRQALATSVRKSYVDEMLMPLVNNVKNVWGTNPKLAMSQWKWFQNWVKDYRDRYLGYVTKGIPNPEIQKLMLKDEGIHGVAPGFKKTATGFAPTTPSAPAPQVGAQMGAFGAGAPSGQMGAGMQPKTVTGSDGKQYTREELQQIAGGQ